MVYHKKESDSAHYSEYQQQGTDKKQKNNYLLSRLKQNDKPKVKNLVKNDGNLKKKLKQEFIFLYIYGINNQDLKSLIKTLRLPIIITKEIQYADAVLALANLVKNNRKLKQISHSKKITIHTIQSNSLLQIAKALRMFAKNNSMAPLKRARNNDKFAEIISREFLTPLEEARLVIEEIVIAKKTVIDLFPRTSLIRKQQHELIAHYQLTGVSVGEGKKRRLRIFPKMT